MRKQTGRMSIVMIVAIAAVIGTALIFIIFGRTESETKVASDFMRALGSGDVAKLTELSYMDGETPESVQKKWEKTLGYSKHYRFLWLAKRSLLASPDEATVTLGLYRNARTSGSYEEKYELPLKRVDGKWKVDVRGISRTMFPSLPR